VASQLALLVPIAATLGLVVYWVAQRLPLPAPPPRIPRRHRSLLYPVEAALERELQQAHLPFTGQQMLIALVMAAGCGGLLAWPFQNQVLTLIAVGACGLMPYQLVRSRIRARARRVNRVVGPALVHIAKICEVRHHPFLALVDALPMLEQPLKTEFERAVVETQAGAPLPEALRDLATRNCDNFYLHQLAELVEINIRSGGDLADSLQRLATRMRTMDELRAEESAELFGYTWLTRILFVAALLPLPYWALTGSAHLRLFVERPLASGLLVWVVASGLAIASLPYWMALDD
jgi:hypothetical protein